MDTTDHNDWSQSAIVELSVANILFRGYTPAPASPPRSSASCEARPVLSEYLTFPAPRLFGNSITRFYSVVGSLQVLHSEKGRDKEKIF